MIQVNMIRKIRPIAAMALLIVAMTAFSVSSAMAAVPQTIPYQGQLTDAAGVVVNGPLDVTFSLYSVASGGQALWSETHTGLNVSNGLFRVDLGSVIPFPVGIFTAPVYLGIKAGSDPEMTPRAALGSTPYALHADDADTVGGFTSTELQGAQGPQGPTGPQGPQGLQGTQGPAGSVPSGVSVLSGSTTPPTGFTYTGLRLYLSSGPEDSGWQSMAPMPTGRNEPAVAESGGKLYVFGGEMHGLAGNATEEYAPATNTWAVKSSLPTARYGMAAATANGKIYVIGGRSTVTTKVAVNEEYNPATDKWITRAPMPTARYGLVAVNVGGKIYAIGGSGGTNRAIEVYDPGTDSWTVKAASLTIGEVRGATVGGKIYLFDVNSTQTSTVEYDPATETSTLKGARVPRRSWAAVATVGGKIYDMGGTYNGPDYLRTNEVYDPATDSWVTQQSLPAARQRSAAAAVNGKIYLLGGSDISADSVTTNEEFIPGQVMFVHTKN